MEFIKITKENLEKEHICCAISNERDCQVISKKSWLNDRFDEGLVFLKGNVRGKCFIEYIPAKYAWAPLEADEYMYINCLWVSGQLKGKGYSRKLLDECIKDSQMKNKKGLVIISSQKKMGFLSEAQYLKYMGFETVDTAAPYFNLMYLPFDKSADKPHFKKCVRECANIPDGFTLYYTSQCPFTAKYVPLLENVAKKRNVEFHTIHILTKEQAQNHFIPWTTFGLFFNGKLITHEILSEKKFEKIINDFNL